jgi:rhomboid protease GluP
MAVRTPQVRPTVTYSLLTITVVVYLLQMSSQYLLNGTDLPALFGMKANELIIQGHFWRLITPVLLHGSILHLGFNMYALFILGPMLERHYGHWPFLGLYLVSGFAGNVMSFLFSSAPSLGSSTAIFGLLGAQAVLLYQNRALFGPTAQRALINLITIAVINLVIGMSPGIDNWGHIGGLLAGTLFAWFGGPVLQVEGIYPELRVVNNRKTADTLRAGLSVVILFAALAVINVFLIME